MPRHTLAHCSPRHASPSRFSVRLVGTAVRVCLALATAALAGAALAACAPAAAHQAPAPAAADSALARAAAAERAIDAPARRLPAGGTLAVLPFAVAPRDTAFAPLGYALADLLTTDLARSPRVALVERARLGEVLRELALTTTGRVDSLTGPRAGRLMQARRLVVGSLGATGDRAPDLATGAGTLRLGARLADVASGTVVEAVDARAPLADVLAAEKALAFRVFEALGVVLTPGERADVEQRPTSNIAALLAYGRGVREEYDGNFRGAVDQYRRALRLDPHLRAAANRAAVARTLSETGTLTPILVPGLRAVDGAVASAIDRLNRPLDPISSLTRPNTVTDPAFPVTTSTVVIVVTQP
ncbi:MAG TPA: CsgG/HfaB family protein [Gemmatirosa sp.]